MTQPRVSIIDGGGANIASLRFALERLGVESELSRDAGKIREASHVILPGVGAAQDAMQRLRAHGLDEFITTLEQPVLGICLGMQLLAAGSDEGSSDCLGIVPGRSAKLQATPTLTVPNMGWCPVRIDTSHPILDGIADHSYFYFVHSYALPLSEHTLASASHGARFSAVIGKDNFLATQFHPERSSSCGSRLLRNFLGLSS